MHPPTHFLESLPTAPSEDPLPSIGQRRNSSEGRTALLQACRQTPTTSSHGPSGKVRAENAEQRLRESEDRFEKIFLCCPESVSIARLSDGTLLEINDAFLEWTGHERDQVLGKPSLEIDLWKDPGDRKKFVDELKENRSLRNYEAEFKHKNGAPIEVLISAEIVSFEQETCILAIARDITERKRMLNALRFDEERYKFALAGSTDGIWDWNLKTGEVYYSDRFRELLGFSTAEFPNRIESWLDHLHPDDREGAWGRIQDCLNSNNQYEDEFRIRTKWDDYLWFKSRGQAHCDSKGIPIRMIGSVQDRTEKKRVEQALQESEERFRKYFDLDLVGMAISTTDLNWVEYNKHFCDLLGYTMGEIEKLSWSDLI
ncbi:MAG: PAS domain S-box protein, partial [Candidatus Omnitrophica bacterium]|nr:PAS domain S-box protein [Candidatus Omnitrophota bacterium]